MKIRYLILLSVLLSAACQNSNESSAVESGNAAHSASDDVSSTNNDTQHGDTRHEGIEGGWNLVWASYNGKIRDTGKPIQFMLFSHSYFSYLGQSANFDKSPNGQWQQASTGTYELTDRLYKAKFMHSTVPQYVGAYAEWTYELRGDTLLMEGPTRVLNAQGNEAPELADGLNKWKEIRVRAKP